MPVNAASGVRLTQVIAIKTSIPLSMLVLSTIMTLGLGQARADALRVAVASNFTTAMTAIAQRFEAQSGHRLRLSFGSTGKHYAQIINGAPFDVFFAADVRRPALLEEQGESVSGSRFTYAIGRLVLWSPRAGYVDADGRVLEAGAFRHLALANPKLAPYGRAAQEVLQARGLWDWLRGQMVRGENIGQSLQFVVSGNAELGFVAQAQVKQPGRPMQGSLWEVPQVLYTPIAQQVILLRDTAAARALLAFVRSEVGVQLIRDHGYDTPP